MESVSQEGAKEGNGGGEMLEGNLNGRTTTFSQPPGTATRAPNVPLPYRTRVLTMRHLHQVNHGIIRNSRCGSLDQRMLSTQC